MIPNFVSPCLATETANPPSNWLHEVKHDGYRMQLRFDGSHVTLRTRTGIDWTHRFPTVAKAGYSLPDGVILDGEIVSLDDAGRSDFSALQANEDESRIVFYAFDLLAYRDADIRDQPLTERKKMLTRLLASNTVKGYQPTGPNGIIRTSDHYNLDGQAMIALARRFGLEGIISKRADAPYRSGRGRDWLKFKCKSRQEFVIAGYEPSDKRLIRALLLGYYEGDELRYVGRVGTGFNSRVETDLVRRFARLAWPVAPFPKVPKQERGGKIKWLSPSLVCETEFLSWTGSGLIRQGTFLGLREDKAPHAVTRQ